MIVALVVGAALQVAIPTPSWIGHSHLPVLLGIVIYYALLRDRALMVACAILAGLLEDSLGRTPLGFTSFAYCLAGWIIDAFRDTVLVRQFSTHAVFGAAANAGITVLIFLLLFKDGLVGFAPLWLLAKIVGTLALGALIVPLVVVLMTWLEQMVGNMEEGEA